VQDEEDIMDKFVDHVHLLCSQHVPGFARKFPGPWDP
jgi:hypothetical protein